MVNLNSVLQLSQQNYESFKLQFKSYANMLESNWDNAKTVRNFSSLKEEQAIKCLCALGALAFSFGGGVAAMYALKNTFSLLLTPALWKVAKHIGFVVLCHELFIITTNVSKDDLSQLKDECSIIAKNAFNNAKTLLNNSTLILSVEQHRYSINTWFPNFWSLCLAPAVKG